MNPKSRKPVKNENRDGISSRGSHKGPGRQIIRQQKNCYSHERNFKEKRIKKDKSRTPNCRKKEGINQGSPGSQVEY